MDLKMQIMLILGTVICFIILIRGVKKGKLRTDYALGWILASITLIVIGVFPQIVFMLSNALGFISPANAVFMLIIFFLIILVYVLFTKVSMLEERQKNIVQEMALSNKDIEEDKKQ